MEVSVLRTLREEVAGCEVETLSSFRLESSDGLGGTHQAQSEVGGVVVYDSLVEHRSRNRSRLVRRTLCEGVCRNSARDRHGQKKEGPAHKSGEFHVFLPPCTAGHEFDRFFGDLETAEKSSSPQPAAIALWNIASAAAAVCREMPLSEASRRAYVRSFAIQCR